MSQRIKIFIDGAARGNPGPAAIGVVIRDEADKVIDELSKHIGIATNNVAEYTALIFALNQAREIGAQELVINTDSELLVKQLGGEYRVKNSNLKELHSKAMYIVQGFSEVKINHIPREQNKEADKLANKALDELKFKKKVTNKSFVLKARTDFPKELF
ncbi:MAG: ribonuclease HI family protein [Candidatus Omnitrophota bacterium]